MDHCLGKKNQIRSWLAPFQFSTELLGLSQLADFLLCCAMFTVTETDTITISEVFFSRLLISVFGDVKIHLPKIVVFLLVLVEIWKKKKYKKFHQLWRTIAFSRRFVWIEITFSSLPIHKWFIPFRIGCSELFQAKLHAYFDFIHIENTVKLLKSSFVCYAIVPASRFNRKMPESGAFSRISWSTRTFLSISCVISY